MIVWRNDTHRSKIPLIDVFTIRTGCGTVTDPCKQSIDMAHDTFFNQIVL